MKPDLLAEVTGDLYRHQRGWSNGDVWETVEWLPERPSWMAHGACAGLDPELFHPEKGGSAGGAVAAAKAVCARCPVRATCLEHALNLSSNECLGVWGATTEPERRALRRERRRGAA